MDIRTLVDTVSSWVWGAPLVILCLGAGVFFSIRTRFLQLRHIKAMVKQLWRGKASSRGISSFQGFAMALGGRVGTGNIAGVATAIAMGGPGALFWMWAIAFLGAGSAFIESTLAQVWKEKRTGEYRGGPSYYIEHGLGMKWFAVIFAV
ncbi:MAG: alanine:cation symporter family protein, partial [Holophagales bacterium]|nr:alanine:cation symporter family protein [Holophagales bacterium]